MRSHAIQGTQYPNTHSCLGLDATQQFRQDVAALADKEPHCQTTQLHIH